MGLLDGVNGHVSGTGYHHFLAGNGVAPGLEHFLGEEHHAIACGFGTGPAAAPVQPLAGKHAGFVAVGNALVLAEQVADFPAANANIPGGHVGVLAQMAIELGHQALTETHDFVVGFAFRVKITAALAATDGQAGQGVLENLFEAQEFDDAQVHGRVETHAALVGSQGAVEFHPEGSVDVDFAFVVLPGHPENDLPFRLTNALDNFLFCELGILHQNRAECFQNFVNRLMELAFSGISVQHILKDGLQFFIQFYMHLEYLGPAESRR